MPCSTTNETRSLPLLRPQPIANHKRSASSFAKDNQSFCWRRCRWAELMHAGSPQKVLSHFACRTFLASAWAQGNGEARDMIPVPAFDPEARLGRLAKLIFRLQVASLASRACNSFSSLPMLQSTKTETVNAIARRCKANCLALALLHSGLKALQGLFICSTTWKNLLERICLCNNFPPSPSNAQMREPSTVKHILLPGWPVRLQLFPTSVPVPHSSNNAGNG